jgi:uncharacterized protein YecE (DUF72 family)
MADFKSQGTFGLSHFRNSRASQELYEPVYLNLFTVQFQLPASMGVTPEETNLLLENVQTIGGLKSHKFPSNLVSQQYKWATRRFAGAKPTETTMDLSLTFEVNVDRTPSMYILKLLRRWCDLVYDPLTGRTGIKADYVAPWMLITMYDRAARPFWQWKCYNVFPMSSLPEPALNYMSEEIYKVTDFLIAVDMWDETIV